MAAKWSRFQHVLSFFQIHCSRDLPSIVSKMRVNVSYELPVYKCVLVTYLSIIIGCVLHPELVKHFM